MVVAVLTAHFGTTKQQRQFVEKFADLFESKRCLQNVVNTSKFLSPMSLIPAIHIFAGINDTVENAGTVFIFFTRNVEP